MTTGTGAEPATQAALTEALHSGCTAGDLCLRAVRRFSDRVALVDDHESVTYGELGARISWYAHAFLAAGLKRGDGLAQLSVNRINAVAVLAAAWVSGLRYTPLHPRATDEDRGVILADAEVGGLVVDDTAFPNAAHLFTDRLVNPRAVFRLSGTTHETVVGDTIPAIAAGWSDSGTTANDIAAILYTGGTTGRPKGVVLTHRALVANALIELTEFDWPREVRFLAVTPISHATLGFLLPVLLKGGTFVLREQFSPAAFFDDVARLRITATFLVPTMLTVLLDSPCSAAADTASLEMIVYGASSISPVRLAQAIRRFGQVFVQMYGQTEAPNVITVLRQADHDLMRPERLASCGVPSTGLEVRLLNDEGNTVEPGRVGELCVRGPLVMQGYWRRPEETATTLAGEWLHTGDLARAGDDGYLTIVDRKKDLIITGGFNVIPREIEDVLASHPGVAQVCVIGVPDIKWGEAVKAVVVLHPNAQVSADELIQRVRDTKGAVCAPKSVDFVPTIPLTAVGKPDKKALRARFWRGHERQVI